jgi:hypothetical protein
MPDEGPKRARPSWKRAAQSAAPSAESTHEWNRLRNRGSGKANRPWFGSLKVAAAVAGTLACLAVIVALIFLLFRPESVAVVLVGSDYADNLLVPHNVMGAEGLAGIETLAKTPASVSFLPAATLSLIQPLQALDQVDQWETLIEGLAKKKFQEKTILLVVALHGGSDPTGAYLMPGKMAGPEDQLKLADMIASLARLPRDKQKILVVEGAQASANWRLGMMHNDFARQLEELEDDIRKVPNLWVLSAADVDQRCWVSEGLGRTVFSHYLIEALRGKASGVDGQLTLDELHDYVFRNVRDWVWNARRAIQEPVLLPRPEHASAGEGKKHVPGARKVAERANVVNLVTVDNAPPPRTPGDPEREELRGLWQRFHRLDQMVPHPTVYSPRRWRQYRAELVRLEQLVEAGASSRSGTVKERLSALDPLLESERFLKRLPSSQQNTLAMNVLTGGKIETAAVAAPEFLAFWKARTDADGEKEWEKLKSAETSGDDARPPLRIRMDAFLLQRALENPSGDLARAAAKLRITQGSDFPQPAELHFLRMVAGWRETPIRSSAEFWSSVSKALTVRRLAERAAVGALEPAAGYSLGEQIHPWIKQQVDSADQHRRTGEDLLFSSEKSAWEQAEKSLREANVAYDDAVALAARIRGAIAARDRALATLPDYSFWLAHRRAEELHDDLTTRVEKLWATAHQLSERLAKPNDKIDAAFFGPASKDVSDGLEKLADRFNREASRIDTNRAEDDWEAATAAAAVPFPDSSDDLSIRTKIWKRLDNIQKYDRELTERNLEPAKISLDDRERETRRVRRRAQIQGLMAMAALGPWFDDPEEFKSAELGDHDSTLAKIAKSPEDDEDRVEKWSKTLAGAGDLIGQRWRRLIPRIDRLMSEEKGVTKHLQEFTDSLIKADRLGRHLDGSAPPLDGSTIEATARLRQVRVHDVLLKMSERAWRDHWYSEDPNVKPYYRVIGERYLSDAGNFLPRSEGASAELERLIRKGNLELAGPPTQAVTSERSIGLSYSIASSLDLPEPGFAVVKPVPGHDVQLLGDPIGYQAVAGDDKRDPIEFAIQSPLIPQFEKNPSLERRRVVKSSLKVEGFFRGQIFDRTTDLDLHPVPDTVAIGPPPADPPDAQLAVRASKEIIGQYGDGTGSIAIVLDCSGSMVVPDPGKFRQAKSALGDVLYQIPKGTNVSLWTFSQLPGHIPSDANGVVPQQFVPEVNRLADHPELTIAPLRPPGRWSTAEADVLIRKLDQIRPYFETPLVQAMTEAAKKDLTDAKGLKTLLVLTDGEDNQLEKNLTYNPKRSSKPDFIVNNFKPLNIQVNMIFFTPAGNPAELGRARRDFEGALNRLEPKGGFVKADDLAELKDTLKRGIRQKLTYQILRPDKTPVIDQVFDVTGPSDADKWSIGLKPGSYTLRVLADQPYDQEIDLKKGDRLVVNLVDTPGKGIGFQRALYSDAEDFARDSKQEQGGWRLAVLANKLARQAQSEELQLAASLERLPVEQGSDRIQQVYPRLAWFQLDALDGNQSEAEFSVRWHERIFYPGPVWQFNVPRWSKDFAGTAPAKPTLSAWWSDYGDNPSPARHFLLGGPGKTDRLPRDCPVDDGKTVRIESIEREDHLVEIWPGKPLETKSCLVVRLAFPANSPYIVDPKELEGVEAAGYEHRVYARANKYTGLFWPVNQPQFEKLTKLSLISLGALRSDATSRKHTAEIKLERPRDDDQIPGALATFATPVDPAP